MGMFDHIKVGEDVDLPHFPEDWPRDLGWQTKDLTNILDTFKVTTDGLLRKERTYREKTQEEKDQMAREYTDGSAETWEEWEDMSPDTTFDAPLPSWSETVDEEWWANHNYHGSIKFYTSSHGHDFLDDFLEYEARFTKGDLDEVILISDKEVLEE